MKKKFDRKKSATSNLQSKNIQVEENSKSLPDVLPEWNLDDLYKSIADPEIDNDFLENVSRVDKFIDQYHLNIANNQDEDFLFSAISDYQHISEVFAKIACFAYLNYAKNLSNQQIISFFQNITEKVNEQESRLVFFSLEINKISEDRLNMMLKSPKLKDFVEFVANVRSYRQYQLSEEVEKILIEKSAVANNAWVRLFDETVTNLQFDYAGRKINSQEAFNLMANNRRLTREKAAKSIAKTFAENIKTFAFITNILAKDKAIDDRCRGFKTVIAARNVANNIEDEVVATMINQVKVNYRQIAHRYYKIKAKILGLEKLKFWDRNAPLQKKTERLIDFSDARALVLQAYADFHPEMAVIANKFFEHRWIDAKPLNAKDSGAFSHPAVPSVHPYILMNYQGKIRDVATLAHELGHGIHQFLARDRGFFASQTPLTLAETASVFGEQLVFQRILKEQKNLQQKMLVIANKVEDMINTTIRQIAFLEFETRIHNARKSGELSVDQICNFWLEVQQESLGDAFDFDGDYRYFWCYIPHFIHSPFYVYAYAFGDCLVNSLYASYCSGKISNFEEKYLELLKKGGSEKYSKAIEPFALDLKSPAFWQGGLDLISSYIDKIEAHFLGRQF